MCAPGPGEVLVESRVSAISQGTELLVYRGQVPRDLPLDATIASLSESVAYPLKYGYALAGTVAEIGPGVEPHWRGRHVFAFHPHESSFVARPDDLIALEDGLPLDDAALLANMETALNLVMDGRPMIGERVAVIGQGVVGLLVTALLARHPLGELCTVDSLRARCERSLSLGADRSLDPDDAPAAGTFDLVYELSGNPEALNTALGLAGYGSRIVVGSWYGEKTATIELGGHFHRDRIEIISSQVSTISPALSGRWDKARRLDLAQAMLGEVMPASLVTHRFHIRDAAQAYAMLDECPGDALQVLLIYDD